MKTNFIQCGKDIILKSFHTICLSFLFRCHACFVVTIGCNCYSQFLQRSLSFAFPGVYIFIYAPIYVLSLARIPAKLVGPRREDETKDNKHYPGCGGWVPFLYTVQYRIPNSWAYYLFNIPGLGIF